jgi:hypothetical protein
MSDQELVDLLGVIKELRDERSLPEPYQPPTPAWDAARSIMPIASTHTAKAIATANAISRDTQVSGSSRGGRHSRTRS